MKYLVLRDCYVKDRYFGRGQVVDLHEGFPVYEKNFRLLDRPVTKEDGEVIVVTPIEDASDSVPEAPVEKIETLDETPRGDDPELAQAKEIALPPSTSEEAVREPGLGEFRCAEHGTIHRETSASGKRHLKHASRS